MGPPQACVPSLIPQVSRKITRLRNQVKNRHPPTDPWGNETNKKLFEPLGRGFDETCYSFKKGIAVYKEGQGEAGPCLGPAS